MLWVICMLVALSPHPSNPASSACMISCGNAGGTVECQQGKYIQSYGPDVEGCSAGIYDIDADLFCFAILVTDRKTDTHIFPPSHTHYHSHAHTHTRTHTHIHARTGIRTHMQTEKQNAGRLHDYSGAVYCQHQEKLRTLYVHTISSF